MVVICFVIVVYAVFFCCFYAIFAEGFPPGPGVLWAWI
jgi:hypothetical protein